MKLSHNFKLPAMDYANQGNAILGIRDTGKTYTAMKAAEELLDAGIPIIVYDPVGIWKNLKVGVNGNKGYNVVVAGGEGSDIIITKNNAKDIVRAAMQQNVSLVIDLYCPELANKSTWIHIVQETIDLLMYSNKPYGPRHIFIEEAAEFIPQRLMPQQAKVYGSIERLARMGRNALLGYTLINQRAEEVNKAILEISAFILLHKQTGKNSLLSIQKWLDVMQVEKPGDIVKTLPNLLPGECWAIGMTDQPVKIKVLPKKTFHPNPKAKVSSKQSESHASNTVDVSSFVASLNMHLHNANADRVLGKSNVKNFPVKDRDLAVDKAGELEISLLNQEIARLRKELTEANATIDSLVFNNEKAIEILGFVKPKNKELFKHLEQRIPMQPKPIPTTASSKVSKPSSGAMRMLQAAAMYAPGNITKIRMATLSGLSHKSGSFGTYLSKLKTEGLIVTAGSELSITNKGLEQVGDVPPMPTDPTELIEMWCGIIGPGSGAARMLRELGRVYPEGLAKHELGEATGLAYSSGSFGTYMAKLKSNGLIFVGDGIIKASSELFL